MRGVGRLAVIALGLMMFIAAYSFGERRGNAGAELTDTDARSSYEARTRAALDDLESKYQALKDKAEAGGGEAEAGVREQLARLGADIERARGELNDLKNSSSESWDRTKGRMESVLTDLKASVEGLDRRLRREEE